MGSSTVDVVVVGAGFSGLYMLHRLRGAGRSAVVLEAGDGVGGTWYWNRYPGARCDSESWSYSYSFSPELEREWEWTERFPSQPEVLAYLEHVAERFDLYRDIRLGARVLSARWESDHWAVHTDHGDWRCQYLVTAVGCLSASNVAAIEGLDSFRGEWQHTGAWPHEGVELEGRRVGVIGTGSTGIQLVPEIAAGAAHLTVFQRTANYSVPARNAPMAPGEMDRIRQRYPALRRLQRSSANGHPYLIAERSTFDVGADERRAMYEAGWERGGLVFRAMFSDMLTRRDANEEACAFIRDKIRETVHDPATAEALVPTDHPFGAKRPPIDTGYFETYNLDHVRLVDLRKAPIERITPDGVLAGGEEHPLDLIVFATGFDALTGPLRRLNLRGENGATLDDLWADGPVTLYGLGVPGFPNLFTITGPGSPSVLVNMPTGIEQHVDWIADCLDHLDAHGHTRIDADPDEAARWRERTNAAAERTLIPLAESSWYLGANIPGKPRAVLPYAGGFAAYARICDDVALQGYPGFAMS